MIIILEGADLTGKTTLAKKLSAKLEVALVIPWVELSDPKPCVISVAKTLHSALGQWRGDVILDRFFTSEYIYAALASRERDYIIDLLLEWDGILVLFVLLVADQETLLERYKSRGGDKYWSVDQIIQVNSLYPSVLEVLPKSFRSLTIDTGKETEENCIDIVLSEVGKR